jgi:hypothetical protein
MLPGNGLADNTDVSTTAVLLRTCVDFINAIGIRTRLQRIDGDCFLPGLTIEAGTIIIDPERLEFPGDILHEAGHVAVVPAIERAALDAASIEKRPRREAEEMMAIAWSYAACVHLGIDPGFVFHDSGYKGGGNYIAENFKEKKYFGLPMLQWIGMAADEKNAKVLNIPPYPHMIKWVLD